MRKFFYLLILFALPLFIHAQFVVKGVVKDAANNQPVTGVTISIPNTSIAVSTDANGRFTMLSSTDFDSIVVSSIGYTSKHIAVQDKSQCIAILLSSTSISLSAVEVLGKTGAIASPRSRTRTCTVIPA